MDTTRTRKRHLGGAVLAVALLSACEFGLPESTTSTDSAPASRPDVTFPPNQLGITDSAQLPDPCALLAPTTISGYLGPNRAGDATAGSEYDGVPMLFRTCQWGDTDGPDGAIGVQVGVANEAGRDVVYNRSTVMDPALVVSIGEDGRETLYMGELPTGGAKGATIFFRTNGYSVLIGHVGPGAALNTVELLGTEVLGALGGS